MAKVNFKPLCILTFVVFANANPISVLDNLPKGWIHWGPFKTTNTKSGEIQTSDLIISPNSASWSDAETDCKAVTFGQGDLVAIETPQELENVLDALANTGLGYEFWTSGKYDAAVVGSYKWASTNNPIGSFAPWDEGHQASPGSPLNRVAILFNDVDYSFWQVQYKTVFHRYICEIRS